MSPIIIYIFLYFAILVSTRFFQFIPLYGSGFLQNCQNLLILFLFIVLAVFGKSQKRIIFKKEILALTIIPFLSAIPCYLYRHQSIGETFLATKYILYWLFYFVLIKCAYDSQIVLKVMKNLAVIVALIFIFQQVLYPSFYLFDDAGNTMELEQRNGLYRFRLFWIIPYVYIAFYYFLEKYIKTKDTRNFLFTAFLIIPIYLTLTRQIWFCILLPIFFYPLINGGRISAKKFFQFTICFILLYIVYLNIDVIVGKQLMERTQDENSSDNVRVLAMEFYGLEYWENWFNVLLGNGCPYGNLNEYGHYISNMEKDYGLYRSDIGIVGVFSLYGLAYIAVLIALYVKTLKNFKYISTYLRLLVIASILNLPLACWTDFPIFMSIIYFLIDRDINKNKLLKIR